MMKTSRNDENFKIAPYAPPHRRRATRDTRTHMYM